MRQNGSNDFARKQAVKARHLVRIVHGITGRYLHQSGEGWVIKSDYAWSGLKHQAATLISDRAEFPEYRFEYVHTDSSAMSLKKAIEA